MACSERWRKGAFPRRALFGGANPAPTSYPTDTSCVSVERTLIKAIMHDPGDYYVNLHNAKHPGGVMRAQLQK